MKETLYTLRWIAKKILGTTTEASTKSMVQEQIDEIAKALGETEVPRPAEPAPVKPTPIAKGLGMEWYPKAHKHSKRMKTRGKYPKGYPYGAVVHFTAGRSGGLKKAIASIDGGIDNGFAFDCIADTGEIVQARPISEYGSHAGVSAWKEKLLSRISGSVSDELLGIEINNAGKVAKVGDGFQTWFKTYLSKDEVRYVTEEEYGCPTGYYHKFTAAQEKTLIEYLLFLKLNDPVGCFDFDLVLAHHEVAGKRGIGYFRKNDCGGALSMPMEKFRELLKKEYAKLV